jgi:putative Holliday junction resolvase
MGRIMSLDPGSKRIGVAVSDRSRAFAFERYAIDATQEYVEHIESLVEEEGVTEIIVGLPLGLDGTETASTEMARDFHKLIVGTFPEMTVHLVDERYTTKTASRRLSEAGVSIKEQRQYVDSQAAAVLLQMFLDSNA